MFMWDNLKTQEAALERKVVRFGEVAVNVWRTRTTISLPGVAKSDAMNRDIRHVQEGSQRTGRI
jgi:hypothetical protein